MKAEIVMLLFAVAAIAIAGAAIHGGRWKRPDRRK